MRKRYRKRLAMRTAAVCASVLFFGRSLQMAPILAQTQTTKPDPVIVIETMPEAETTVSEPVSLYDWDATDREVLMKIAMAEAEGEGLYGKALVMNVVLNRVARAEFPKTIEDVVFQKKQFSPVVTGGRYWTTEPDEECAEALELVAGGWDGSDGALYFESVRNTSTWHKNHLEYLFQYGDHIFYR